MKKIIIIAMTLITIMSITGCQKKEDCITYNVKWSEDGNIMYCITTHDDYVKVEQVDVYLLVDHTYEYNMNLFYDNEITMEELVIYLHGYEIRDYDESLLL